MGCLGSIIGSFVSLIMFIFKIFIVVVAYLIMFIITFIVYIFKLRKEKKQNYNKYVDNSKISKSYRKMKYKKGIDNKKNNLSNNSINLSNNKDNINLSSDKNITNSDSYLKIYIKKKYKELLKDDSLNIELLNIPSFDAPMIYYDDCADVNEYYVFEAWECSSATYGNLLEKLYKYCFDDFYATISYDDKFINYKFISTNKAIMLNGKGIDDLIKHYQSLKNKIISFADKLYDYFIYIEDENFYNDVVPNYDLDCDSISILSDKLKETNDILIYEIPYLEEISMIIDIIEPKIIRESELGEKRVMDSLPDIEIIDSEDEEIVYKKENKKEKEMSWKDKQFEEEADLWGLSEEDRRIAKEERMSPAEFVEAEEYDDDELLLDEWER